MSSAVQGAPSRWETQRSFDELGRPLRDITFTVVDLETTGGSAQGGSMITEIGAVKVRGGEILGEFQTLVNPHTQIPAFIAVLTGITNSMVADAPTIESALPAFLEFAHGSVLVAHNAPFDTSFLNHEISRVYPGHRMVNPHLCTVRLSRRALPDLVNHRLDTIASHFSIPIISRHRAGSDALATAEIFLRILKELEETHGIKDLAAARTFQFPELAAAAQV